MEGEVASGHFYAEDLEQVRRKLLAEGHCPKVVMRSMSEWRCLRLRVRGGEDCVIYAFHEDLDVLQAWMGRQELFYRQRLAGAASEVPKCDRFLSPREICQYSEAPKTGPNSGPIFEAASHSFFEFSTPKK